MAVKLQEVIHSLEAGAGYRVLKYGAGLAAMLTLALFYNLAAFKNLSAPEAMDAAQLARNLAEGRGYSTWFIRPLSMHLVFRAVTNQLADLQPDETGRPRQEPTPAQLKLIGRLHLEEPHPDLAHPPVYPLLLAGWLKLLPYDYEETAATAGSRVHKPDLWITFLNQGLFMVAGVLLFGLARKLFDEPVAWVTLAVLFGAELFWRFSVSGLSTLLLVVFLVGLVRLLAELDRAARTGKEALLGPHGPLEAAAAAAQPARVGGASGPHLVWLAGLSGVLVGLAGLTRYSFAWLIVPVVLFVASVPARRRGLLAAVALGMFAVVMAPWVARNLGVSGTPFGTAGYAVLQGTSLFPGDQLERTLYPDFSLVTLPEYWQKLWPALREIVQSDLPRLGGSWVSAFFLVGLLVPFRNPTLGRLRWFMVGSLALFAVVQALGRTHLTTETPEVNSENLLAAFAPVVFLYGVGLFFVLLDQIALPAAAGRFSVIGAFCLINGAPLALVYLAPPASALSYPPYFPAGIQDRAGFLKEDDLCMTDLPWAVAWYGQRQAVWLSLKFRSAPTDRWQNDFFAIHQQIKPVHGLYLSNRAMKHLEVAAIEEWGFFSKQSGDSPGESEEEKAVWRWQGGKATGDWAQFILQTLFKREVPDLFPLRSAPRWLVPELFLTDSERAARKPI
jgi:hypothetical protein